MSAYSSPEMRKYQRRLIPVNIVVMILCAVAALSLFFRPILTVDIGKAAGAISESMESPAPTAAEVSPAEEGKDDGASALFLTMLGGGSVSVTLFDFRNVLFGEDPMQQFVGIFADELEGFLAEAAGPVAARMISEAAADKLDKSAEDVNVDKVLEKLSDLETATPETKDACIDALIDEIAYQLVAVPNEETKSEIRSVAEELYDQTAERNGGKFSVEACVCLVMSDAMEEEGQTFTSYADIADMVAGTMLETFNAPEDANSFIPLAIRIGVGVMMFFVAVWVVLFLAAFFRLFFANKRFTMWYVKLFGGVPCLVFWGIPYLVNTLGVDFFAGYIGEAAAMLTPFAAISSLAWISGICYLLLWFVSVFWAFPIKRKIRKLLRQGEQR